MHGIHLPSSPDSPSPTISRYVSAFSTPSRGQTRSPVPLVPPVSPRLNTTTLHSLLSPPTGLYRGSADSSPSVKDIYNVASEDEFEDDNLNTALSDQQKQVDASIGIPIISDIPLTEPSSESSSTPISDSELQLPTPSSPSFFSPRPVRELGSPTFQDDVGDVDNDEEPWSSARSCASYPSSTAPLIPHLPSPTSSSASDDEKSLASGYAGEDDGEGRPRPIRKAKARMRDTRSAPGSSTQVSPAHSAASSLPDHCNNEITGAAVSSTERNNDMFLPSTQFHDSLETEGKAYEARVEENVKKYKSEIKAGKEETENKPTIPTEDFAVPAQRANYPGPKESLSSQEEGSTTEQGEEGSSLQTPFEQLPNDGESPTDTEGAASYAQGHPLKRMPGKVKGFNEAAYYHHKLYPNFRYSHLHRHYLDPMSQLQIFGEAEGDRWDEDPSPSSSRSSVGSIGEAEQFQRDYDAGEGAWQGSDSTESPHSIPIDDFPPNDSATDTPGSPFHLPLTTIVSSSGHDVRILLRSIETLLHARRRAQGGRPLVEVSEDVKERLAGGRLDVDEKGMLIVPQSVDGEKKKFVIKQLALSSPELRLFLELNQLEVRSDSWNRTPPILDLLEVENKNVKSITEELEENPWNDKDSNDSSMVQLVFGYLTPLDDLVARAELTTFEDYMNLFGQLLEGLVFLSAQKIMRLNCSSPSSFMVGHGAFATRPSTPCDDPSELVHLVRKLARIRTHDSADERAPSRASTSSASSISSITTSSISTKSGNTEVWDENEAPAPRYYFMDFSNAQNLSSITPGVDPHDASIGASEKRELQAPSAKQDVYDLGTLFGYLVASSPPVLQSTLNNHFTLLISAMTDGGFTAEEARRLHLMISQKWEEGGRFRWGKYDECDEVQPEVGVVGDVEFEGGEVDVTFGRHKVMQHDYAMGQGPSSSREAVARSITQSKIEGSKSPPSRVFVGLPPSAEGSYKGTAFLLKPGEIVKGLEATGEEEGTEEEVEHMDDEPESLTSVQEQQEIRKAAPERHRRTRMAEGVERGEAGEFDGLMQCVKHQAEERHIGAGVGKEEARTDESPSDYASSPSDGGDEVWDRVRTMAVLYKPGDDSGASASEDFDIQDEGWDAISASISGDLRGKVSSDPDEFDINEEDTTRPHFYYDSSVDSDTPDPSFICEHPDAIPFIPVKRHPTGAKEKKQKRGRAGTIVVETAIPCLSYDRLFEVQTRPSYN